MWDSLSRKGPWSIFFIMVYAQEKWSEEKLAWLNSILPKYLGSKLLVDRVADKHRFHNSIWMAFCYALWPNLKINIPAWLDKLDLIFDLKQSKRTLRRSYTKLQSNISLINFWMKNTWENEGECGEIPVLLFWLDRE